MAYTFESPRLHSPVDNTTVLPYARKDAQGNHFFSWKDEQGKRRKKNLGRGEKWYQKYLQYEAQFITTQSKHLNGLKFHMSD